MLTLSHSLSVRLSPSVSLFICRFGRGEDFKYSPAVLEKGGGHAIQLYLTKSRLPPCLEPRTVTRSWWLTL